VLPVGGNAGAEEDVADLELGFAEEGTLVGAEQEAGDLEELGSGSRSDGLRELLDFGFLCSGGYVLHRAFSESRGGFLVTEPFRLLNVQRFHQLSRCPHTRACPGGQ
jgi:hypothetical protein